MGKVVLGVTGGISVTFSLCHCSSNQGLWITMDQYQLILLLLLTKSNISQSVVNYLDGLKRSTNFLNIIPFKDIPGVNKLISMLDFPLKNKNLEYFGVFSGSSFVNNFSLICTILIIIIVHFIYLLIVKMLQNKIKSEKAIKLFGKIKQLFAFSIYIRIMLEVNQFALLSTFEEIYEWDISTSSKIASLCISFIFCISLFIFILICLLNWIKHKETENMDSYYELKEFFSGVQVKPIPKLQSILSLIRRMLFVALLIFGSSLNNKWLIISFIIIEFVYLSLMIAIRPYKRKQDNVLEINNGIFLETLALLLTYYNTSERWKCSIQYIYIGIISVNSLIIITIILSMMCVRLIQVIKKRCKNKEVMPKEQSAKPRMEELKVQSHELHNFTKFKISNNHSSSVVNKEGESEMKLNSMSPSELHSPFTSNHESISPIERFLRKYQPDQRMNK